MSEHHDLDLQAQLDLSLANYDKLRQEYTDFLYSISHDLQAPFRHIQGFAQLILHDKENAFSSKSTEHFDRILSAVDKGSSLLESLVYFSRLNTQPAHHKPLNCNELLKLIINDLQKLFDMDATKIDMSELPEIHGDAKQIHLLFLHVLKNAMMYHHPEQSNQISITFKDINEHQVIEFCIEDHGIGMSDQLLKEVYKPMKRGVADHQYPGSGMGLAIAKRVVESHHGSIHIESQIDKGTKVYVSLPKT